MDTLDTRTFFNYLTYEKRYARNTLKSYSNDIEQFRKFLMVAYELKEWPVVKHWHIRSWMVDLVDSGIAERSVNRKISALKTMFLYFKKEGRISINPMTKVSAPRFGKSLPESIQADRLAKLFDTLDCAEPEEFRNRLIIEIFYTTGMRRAELIALSDGDIDFARQRIKVLGKGNKERSIPVSPELLTKIKKWQALRDSAFAEAEKKSDFLFVTDKGAALYPKWVYNMVTRYLSSVTTQKKCSPHVLRHSFATHLMDGGAELNAVKDLLGHANLAATQIYTHNSIEKLKKVYRASHPKYIEKT